MESWLRRAWLRTSSLGVLGTSLLAACRRVPVHEASSRAVERLREVQQIHRPGAEHWVGDGFWVSTVFSPFQVEPDSISPFLLLDHGAPRIFEPAKVSRGVGAHPHRGFETVTFAYQGEVDHRDSAGGGGRIYPGDVQWMTAASGVVHEEKHSQRFTEQGGTFEMVQLWVNLPATHKMTHPRYQALVDGRFPRKSFGDAVARVIAGDVEGSRGPAKTHTPVTLFDLRFDRAGEASFNSVSDHTLLMVALQGSLQLPGGKTLPERHLAVFRRDGVASRVTVGASGPAKALVLSGKPLGEPVVAHGPFVMNTREQINQAMRDYRAGKMGALRPSEST